ncbi:MAG: hypothetical protein AB7I19_14345 [Planctomycetota bacterium]
MNPNPSPAAQPNGRAALEGVRLRVVAPGLLAAAVGVILGLAGVLEFSPEVATGAYVALGASLAGLTGMLGASLKVAATRRPSTDPLAANALQAALLGDFVLQVLTVGIGATALHLSGMKFPIVAGFGVAFAAVALVHQAGSSLILARALSARSRESAQVTPRSPSAPIPSVSDSPSANLETDA